MTDTYLGRKGYTLIKNRIESKELFIIRRELDVSPNATLMGPQPSFQINQVTPIINIFIFNILNTYINLIISIFI